jgi:hypothetical protein
MDALQKRVLHHVGILTIEELLSDPDRPHPRCLRTPPRVLRDTFKEAPKDRRKDGKQLELGGYIASTGLAD